MQRRQNTNWGDCLPHVLAPCPQIIFPSLNAHYLWSLNALYQWSSTARWPATGTVAVPDNFGTRDTTIPDKPKASEAGQVIGSPTWPCNSVRFTLENRLTSITSTDSQHTVSYNLLFQAFSCKSSKHSNIIVRFTCSSIYSQYTYEHLLHFNPSHVFCQV